MNRGRVRAQDLVVASVLGLDGFQGYQALAAAAGISVGEGHASLKRLQESGLVSPARQLLRLQFLELLTHGARFVWPLKPGALGRGVPTAGAAPMFVDSENFPAPSALPFVWASNDDDAVPGIVVEPLFSSVPRVARENPRLYAVLALIDALRQPQQLRERKAAAAELKSRLGAA
jgi:hypothetical protein